ncbi:hypothetical protein FH972_011590 [Carpinus fangiana]|uniref:Uncharacterized protein n=1 Tax=Carpinus fangiana TaxID=176857 RepID=A0A660KRX3_9ROSI|nr:hypothetical protein FH972_011590 [Carpinus fangiana]
MMAVDLHSTELLLPSHFLYDEEEDDILPKNLKPTKVLKESSYYNPWEAHQSALSSPVGSELGSGSAESESDKEDDYIAELTRQMAHYMLQDDDKMEKKTWGSAGSPQSTLWSPLGSSNGSPDGSEPSPPPTPEFAEDPFWDSRYDAVVGLEKMNLNDCEKPKFQNSGLHSNQPPTDHQLRAIELIRLKQERAMIMKQQASSDWEKQANVSQQFLNGRLCSGLGNGGKARTDPWTQTQPPAQCHQQVGSGTRAFSLGGDSGNGSCGTGGTGVFLPRGIWYSSEPRKKPGCSTVYIPARVAQALKLHFDQIGARSRPSNIPAGGSPLPHGRLMMGRSNGGLNSKQKRQSRTVPAMNCHEMGLPQEWTY